MNHRACLILGFAVSLGAGAAGCGGDDSSSSGQGGAATSTGSFTTTTSSSSSGQGGAATSTSSSTTTSSSGGGQGGTGAQGGAGGAGGAGGGQGGAGGGQGGAGGGQGGAGGAGGGQGGAGGMTPVEDCSNMIDDDSDGDTDCADADCAMVAACGSVVINEVDYDQYLGDTAEFVELLNTGTNPVDLSTTSLVCVNGATNMPSFILPLTGIVLDPGQYFVAASAGVTGIPAGALTMLLPNGSIQNGSPDAVALYDYTSKSVLDALSYEGSVTMAMIDGNIFDLVAGNPTTAVDIDSMLVPSFSLIRFPNGQDTGDDLTDWTGTSILTPGAENQKSIEICDNMVDDDGDLLVDCADPDCSAMPACAPSEICDNGVDDDGDMFADCADTDCDGQPCNMSGSLCTAMVCTCPGGTTELTCDDMVDNDCDADTDCADADCAMTPICLMPLITSVDYPVIAQGGTLVVTGNAFNGATAVTLGGLAQPFTVDSNTMITLFPVSDSTPLGMQDIIVTTPGGPTPPFTVTVIRLLINELDCDTPSTDMLEFVEVGTGVPNVNLAGYSLVFWNGNGDASYLALDLNAPADANGLLLLGNVGVMPAPAITWNDNTLQNGPDAAGIYQALANTFIPAVPVTANRLIDALVYDTSDADAPGLLDTLLAPAPDPTRVQVDENGTMTSATVSIQRCAVGRRDGRRFGIDIPTPGAANTLAPCP